MDESGMNESGMNESGVDAADAAPSPWATALVPSAGTSSSLLFAPDSMRAHALVRVPATGSLRSLTRRGSLLRTRGDFADEPRLGPSEGERSRR
jgi:hypothetical protein